jgi:hypothetical protein
MDSFNQLQHDIMDYYENRHPANVRDTIGSQPRPPFVTTTLMNRLRLTQDQRRIINSLIADEIEIANRDRLGQGSKKKSRRNRKSNGKNKKSRKRRKSRKY